MQDDWRNAKNDVALAQERIQ